MTDTFSPYRHAARFGLFLGFYLSVMLIAMLISHKAPGAGLLGLIMMLGVPVFAYRIERGVLTATDGKATASSIWFTGIMSFIGAALLTGAVTSIYFKWIDPTYITDRLTEAATMFSTSPIAYFQDMGHTAQLILETDNIPTATDIAISIMWLISFSGIILSGIVTPVTKAIWQIKKSKNDTNRQ